MFEASEIRMGFFFPHKVTSFFEFGKHGVSDHGNPSNPRVHYCSGRQDTIISVHVLLSLTLPHILPHI